MSVFWDDVHFLKDLDFENEAKGLPPSSPVNIQFDPGYNGHVYLSLSKENTKYYTRYVYQYDNSNLDVICKWVETFSI